MSSNDKKDLHMPPLDRWRADELLEPDRPLWGLKAIANVADVSIDTVRRWYRSTDAPISRPGGRYFSTHWAIIGWLRAR